MVMAVHFVGDGAPQHTRRAGGGEARELRGPGRRPVLRPLRVPHHRHLLDAKGAPHYFRNFYARRTLRIFPLYYGVLVVLFGVIPAADRDPAASQSRLAAQALALDLHRATSTSPRARLAALTYVSHFWSLAVEEHFYLVWPLLVFAFRREALERICVGVIAAGLGLRIVLVLSGVSELSVSVLTPCRIDTLAVGALLALAGPAGGLRGAAPGSRSAPGARARRRGRRGVAVRGAHQALAPRPPPGARLALRPLLRSAHPGLAGPEHEARRRARAPHLPEPAPHFLGKYSYGLYVYHGLFTWYLVEVRANERLDRLFGYHHSLTIVARALLGVGVSVVVAVLSYELMEKKFLALKRYFAAEPPQLQPPARRCRRSGSPRAQHRPESGAAGR